MKIMNREILFRGKRKDNGEWVEGDIHKNLDFSKAHIHPIGERLRSFDVIPETVGQYTGLCDRNGTKIFEGDIIKAKWSSLNVTNTVVGTVKYENATFVLETNEHYLFFEDNIFSIYCEVIGNIYDNSELLEGEENENFSSV